MAVDAQDRILVAGDKAVDVFAPDGKRLNEIKLDARAVLSGGGQRASTPFPAGSTSA